MPEVWRYNSKKRGKERSDAWRGWKVWGTYYDTPKGQDADERVYELEMFGGGSPEKMAEEWARRYDWDTTLRLGRDGRGKAR